MPRVIKHPDIRRGEILDIAAELFATAGYTVTSVDDIIRKAGISKGAFYHHFSSKDALLEGLAERAAAQARQGLVALLADPDLTAVGRLNAFLASGRPQQGERSSVAVFASIFRPENLALYHRLHRTVAGAMVEPLAAIIAAGIAEGSMRSAHPATTAEIILTLGTITHDVIAELLSATDAEARRAATAGFELRMEQQGIAMDRILGLPDGTIRLWDAEGTKVMLAALDQSAAPDYTGPAADGKAQ